MKMFRVFAAVQLFAWCGAYAALDVAVEEPLEVLQSNAAAGDPSAQFNLALSYELGRGVPKDAARALEWYRKAAAAGFSEAQFNLGVLLFNGKDVPPNEKEAARWFIAAGQNGIFAAQKIMVKNYSTGRGVEKSPAQALAWDMLARRTLELRTGVSAGLPPQPGALRADGAAEVAGKDGKKVWILADGSRETIDEAGVRHREHKNGSKTTVQADGAWETSYPGGFTEQVTAQGRRTLRDPKGNLEITEPDGTRIEEGDGITGGATKVRIRDTFGPDGKKISRRVESKVKRDDGVELVLSEELAADGTTGKGKLRRADNGAGPKDSEIWAIQRTLHIAGGILVVVNEKYSEAGFYSQEEVSRGPESKPPVATIASGTQMETHSVQLQPPVTFKPETWTVAQPVQIIGRGSASGVEDPTAFAPKPDISAMLAELQQIENDARNFAGATATDYQRAQATAAAYLIPLSVLPQKTASAPAWLREKIITQTTLHEAPLLPTLDDRSKAVPFGPHGAEIIKRSPWKHAETDHFIVHFLGEAEARLTVQYIEGVYTVLTQLMNLDPQRAQAKSHVFVFPEAEWQSYLKSHGHPAQLAGFAYKTELLLGASASQTDRADSIKVLCHETTHALVARWYPARKPPLWMNEGLAEYIAIRTMRTKGVAFAGKTRDEAQTRMLGKPDANMDIERLFTRVRYGNGTSPDRLAAFYSNSQKCVQVLFEKLPVEGFAKFFNTLSAGNQPEVALAAAFGKQCDSVAAFKRLVNGS